MIEICEYDSVFMIVNMNLYDRGDVMIWYDTNEWEKGTWKCVIWLKLEWLDAYNSEWMWYYGYDGHGSTVCYVLLGMPLWLCGLYGTVTKLHICMLRVYVYVYGIFLLMTEIQVYAILPWII